MTTFDVSERTHFMNVDLDILSARPLDELGAAFGDAVHILYIGREGEFYGGHFELAKPYGPSDAEVLIQSFVNLIRQLPRGARKLWNDARTRDFNVGIQAARDPVSHELRLSTESLKAIAGIGGSVVITTYAPVRRPRKRVIAQR